MADIHNDKAALLALLADTMEDYARAIDLDQLERWPGFFEEKCIYKVTSRENVAAGYPFGVLFADSRGMLVDRVRSLREANVYEGQFYRHLMGRPFILSMENGLVQAETSFLILRTMRTGEMSTFAAGTYQDRVRIADGKASFIERIVVCDSSRVDTLLALPL